MLSPPTVTPKLTAGRLRLPGLRPSAYGDTFGAPRGDVSGGWHHGDDIFAPLGAPLLAVADGTVFSVGWNDVGGYRLWLRDRQGNEFYYAHLSAYTTLARQRRAREGGRGARLRRQHGRRAGNAVPPPLRGAPGRRCSSSATTARSTRRRTSTRGSASRTCGFSRRSRSGRSRRPRSRANAPAPGAILLQATDISTANGLDPASLKRAMRAPAGDVRRDGQTASGSCRRRCRTSTAA